MDEAEATEQTDGGGRGHGDRLAEEAEAAREGSFPGESAAPAEARPRGTPQRRRPLRSPLCVLPFWGTPYMSRGCWVRTRLREGTRQGHPTLKLCPQHRFKNFDPPEPSGCERHKTVCWLHAVPEPGLPL